MSIPGESTSPMGPTYTFHPRNFREIIQRQVNHTVGREVDSATSFTIGDFDGRFLGNFPAETQRLDDDKGRFFHVIGFSRAGDGSVAAP